MGDRLQGTEPGRSGPMHPAMASIRASADSSFPGKARVGDPETRKRADSAVGCVLNFEGASVDVGLGPVDWSGAHVKHQEWPAQLNRFYLLWTLTPAYAVTGDERYAQSARRYMEDWIDHHPPYAPAGPKMPGDSSLNMTMRLGYWLGFLDHYEGARAFDDAFVDKILACVDWQLEWLVHNVALGGNWRINGFHGLLQLGQANAPRGTATGWSRSSPRSTSSDAGSSRTDGSWTRTSC